MAFLWSRGITWDSVAVYFLMFTVVIRSGHSTCASLLVICSAPYTLSMPKLPAMHHNYESDKKAKISITGYNYQENTARPEV